ncbi:alpha/beta hydrolase [Cellulomonas citrea]|uniref:alpha/beta hydrolase n=1 Tax=Cellulomonas citrea TaxID=1909423 RepID=UPI00135B3AE3|nr:dienelactone hydrolase family protein [Cellulomonas citrea]
MSALTIETGRRRPGTQPDAPVLVLLHGYGSHDGDLLPLVDRPDLELLAPRAPLPAGPGFAWAPITVPGAPDPAPVHEATTALLAWLDAHVAPGRRTALLGFSQGGLMVTQLLRARPGAFVAGVVLSGFVLPGEQPGDAVLAADPPPVLFARGDADPVIAPDATARTQTWLAAHTRLDARVYPGMGHTVGAAERDDVEEFLARELPA